MLAFVYKNQSSYFVILKSQIVNEETCILKHWLFRTFVLSMSLGKLALRNRTRCVEFNLIDKLAN